MNRVITTYNSTEDMIDNLQQLRGKMKLRFCKNITNYYDEVKHKNFQTQEAPFSKIYHEVLLLMKILQTKPQVKNMNIKFYDFYYTVVKKIILIFTIS